MKSDLMDGGMDEKAADAAVLTLSLTPAGSALDASQGMIKAAGALQKGDITGAMKHLGSAGLDAVKIGKIRKVLDSGGEKAAKALASSMPKQSANLITKELEGRGVMKKLKDRGIDDNMVRGAMAEALKNGRSPMEALTHGVLSSTAKATIDDRVKALGIKMGEGVKKLSPKAYDRARRLARTTLTENGEEFLSHVAKETRTQVINEVLDNYMEQFTTGSGQP